MQTRPTLYSITKPESGVDLPFYSPDEKRARYVATRLRHVANVHWVDARDISGTREPVRLTGSPLVLLDYSLMQAEHSSMLARRLIDGTPGVSLLAVGSLGTDKAGVVLAALRAGVTEFLDVDAKDEDISELLARVQGEARTPAVALTPVPRSRGRLVLLLGVRAGVGTSTLAAHLGSLASPGKSATKASDAGGAQVLLLDLGRPAGDATLYLSVPNEFHYENALKSARRIDATLIGTAFSSHDSRLSVLSQAPGTLERPADTADLPVLLDRLRQHFELLLTDLGGLPVSEIPLPLLREADEIWLIADQSIGAMVSLDAALRQLDNKGMRDQRLSLVINRHDPGDGVTAAQIAKRFSLPLAALLPDRSRVLRESANQGQLLHESSPRDPYVRALSGLLDKLQIDGASPSVRPWWKQLVDRKGG
ncbi:AAA family ATPase [Rhodanobacter sp. BL-MT-08]